MVLPGVINSPLISKVWRTFHLLRISVMFSLVRRPVAFLHVHVFTVVLEYHRAEAYMLVSARALH